MNIGPQQASCVHGWHVKRHIILHETVSPDYVGWKDILSISKYLDDKDYGIHGITDLEAHIAWAYGFGKAIFWQAGGLNTTGIGIEQISRVMLQAPTNVLRRKLWAARNKELQATAKLCAAISNTQKTIPMRAATWDHSAQEWTPGILSHYQVSQHAASSKGHTDCKPIHLGGYYPLFEVIQMAKTYKLAGYKL